jgi:prepilin-type N-terminal cleavage/methylation domain-containing protein
MLARLRSALRSEGGFTLTELLVVMVIMGVVIGGLTSTFASATLAHADMAKRFEAQEHGRIALDKLRREGHCASVVSVTGTTLVTFTLPSTCPTGSGGVTWCVRAGTNGNELYRITPSSSTCTGGTRYAEYIDTGGVTVFSLPTVGSGELTKLRVVLPVDLTAGTTAGRYSLTDDIALRNTTRT